MISSKEMLDFARGSYSKFDAAGYICLCEEVEYRTCARSAYYALYHYLKSIADKLPGSYEDVSSHEKVIRKLLNSGDPKLMDLAQKMISTRKTRVRADYHIDKNFGKSEAYKILRIVEKIFKDAELSEGEVLDS
ncbi:HEPN domain-containing protein [Klebsiella pneumoniae]|uniref:HEPN domain-containing protein n=1 Tax=Klebsiella pneumoniae TaxID=573 RepID=UPI003971BEF3|nr:HEPN domain-containing protein [Klebsiella pneumoniae]